MGSPECPKHPWERMMPWYFAALPSTPFVLHSWIIRAQRAAVSPYKRTENTHSRYRHILWIIMITKTPSIMEMKKKSKIRQNFTKAFVSSFRKIVLPKLLIIMIMETPSIMKQKRIARYEEKIENSLKFDENVRFEFPKNRALLFWFCCERFLFAGNHSHNYWL